MQARALVVDEARVPQAGVERQEPGVARLVPWVCVEAGVERQGPGVGRLEPGVGRLEPGVGRLVPPLRVEVGVEGGLLVEEGGGELCLRSELDV